MGYMWVRVRVVRVVVCAWSCSLILEVMHLWKRQGHTN